MNHKRVYRLYREAGLNLHSKRPQRRKAAVHRLPRKTHRQSVHRVVQRQLPRRMPQRTPVPIARRRQPEDRKLKAGYNHFRTIPRSALSRPRSSPSNFTPTQKRRIFHFRSASLRGGCHEWGLLSLSVGRSMGAAELFEIVPMSELIANYIHEIGRRFSPESKIHLTPRELQCLRLGAVGKTGREISMLTGIRESTVVFHFRNAMQKLGEQVASNGHRARGGVVPHLPMKNHWCMVRLRCWDRSGAASTT